MVAYLKNDHWLANARAANEQARRLAAGLAEAPGVRMPWPRQANEVFAFLPRDTDAALRAGGVRYYGWTRPEFGAAGAQDAANETFVRLVTSFSTTAAEVDKVIRLARG